MNRKEILVCDDPIAGFAGVVRAGSLLFTSGCDGHRDPPQRCCRPGTGGAGECAERQLLWAHPTSA